MTVRSVGQNYFLDLLLKHAVNVVISKIIQLAPSVFNGLSSYAASRVLQLSSPNTVQQIVLFACKVMHMVLNIISYIDNTLLDV